MGASRRIMATTTQEEIEEERRLLYVATTRARDSCTSSNGTGLTPKPGPTAMAMCSLRAGTSSPNRCCRCLSEGHEAAEQQAPRSAPLPLHELTSTRLREMWR